MFELVHDDAPNARPSRWTRRTSTSTTSAWTRSRSPGTLPAKLAAVRDAGFSQIMLSARDLVGPRRRHRRRGRARCATSGLRVTGFQVLRDFEGLSGHLHDYKIDIAKSMLEMCHALGADVLLVVLVDVGARDRRPRRARRATCASSRCSRVPLGIKVAYEGLSWGRTINEFTAAPGTSCAAPTRPTSASASTRSTRSRPSRRSTTSTCCRRTRSSSCSSPTSCGRRSAPSRSASRPRATSACSPAKACTARRWPSSCTRLDALGYRGDYSFEVFNDDYSQMPLPTVAERARRSAIWLARGRAAPLGAAAQPDPAARDELVP